MPTKPSLAARAGRWSAHHRKTAILGWLAFVIVAFLVGNATGLRTLEDADRGVGESGRADRVLDEAFPDEVADESVLVQGRAGQTVRDPEFRQTVEAVVAEVRRLPGAAEIASPLERENAGQVSRDGRSVLVDYELPDTEAHPAEDAAGRITAAAARVADAHPQMRVEAFGDATAEAALSERFEDDFQRAETLSIPITLVILVVAFGALVAAGLPLLLGLTAVAASLGLVALPSQVLPVDEAISSVILLIGMAVGVDYSLFYLRREREERAAGRPARDAIQVAAATSGRAILVSGLTVMIAMAGMFLTGDATFMSFAMGTIIVVAVAMVGSLTVVPATLAALGPRVEKGRVPFLHRLKRGDGESRLWNALLDRVLRRPAIAAGLATAVLVAMALPALGLNTALGGVDDLPRDIPVMQTYDRIQQAFPGNAMPAVVAVQADDVTAEPVADAIGAMGDEAVATGLMYEPVSVSVSDDRTVASVQIPMAGDGADERSAQALETLREQVIPATVGEVGGVRADVTGMTAGSEDFNSAMADSAPLVFAFVLTLAFLLLLVTFRSVVIPLKAIVLNLLSVGAAYGVLVWVFQDGNLEGLLGFESNGAIASWIPMFLFVILFGLSMDYHVFILSRVREAYDGGMRTEEAVAHGIRTTAGVVTSAAVVMVAVFSIFGTLSMLEFKQMGVGLAVAILLDATLVRGVLLPATMKLLGDWNWYLPRGLRWLPRVTHEPEVAPAKA